mmetsp:Transcript_41/g.36  ORF Transcript_41/g.36 Transcript_41/m.36 type:complete len:81 (-) Transcript_41:235-477(-)
MMEHSHTRIRSSGGVQYCFGFGVLHAALFGFLCVLLVIYEASIHTSRYGQLDVAESVSFVNDKAKLRSSNIGTFIYPSTI